MGTTQNDYLERINKVLHFVNKNLNEPLNVQRLAEISNFSEYHFHRFKYILSY
jgi:AraC family transcriptional regulator